mmetsp:Transcript_15758/g.36177  ORF Transcript_15758/g.36177 Transcript_15758/m.36177 type:complete len:85 (+) Transcript_15758:556-810(+)
MTTLRTKEDARGIDTNTDAEQQREPHGFSFDLGWVFVWFVWLRSVEKKRRGVAVPLSNLCTVARLHARRYFSQKERQSRSKKNV